MKRLAAVLLISTASVGSAFAGNIDIPVGPVAAVEMPTPQDDWGGLYLGGMVSFDSGVWDTFEFGELEIVDTIDSTLYGGFAGFNFQRNALVFGGEVAYSAGSANWDNGNDSGTFDQSFIDAKARVGYAMDNILVYVVGGGSFVSINNGDDTLAGFNYGAGAQMKFDSGMFVGVEYLMRDLTGEYTPNPDWTYEYGEHSIAARVGWQF